MSSEELGVNLLDGAGSGVGDASNSAVEDHLSSGIVIVLKTVTSDQSSTEYLFPRSDASKGEGHRSCTYQRKRGEQEHETHGDSGELHGCG